MSAAKSSSMDTKARNRAPLPDARLSVVLHPCTCTAVTWRYPSLHGIWPPCDSPSHSPQTHQGTVSVVGRLVQPAPWLATGRCIWWRETCNGPKRTKRQFLFASRQWIQAAARVGLRPSGLLASSDAGERGVPKWDRRLVPSAGTQWASRTRKTNGTTQPHAPKAPNFTLSLPATSSFPQAHRVPHQTSSPAQNSTEQVGHVPSDGSDAPALVSPPHAAYAQRLPRRAGDTQH